MGEITAGGKRLGSFLDGLPVEENWIAGHHIVWQTGQQNGPEGVGPEGHTHCSAFAGAVALYLDIYILRPPNHTQELLANAQVAWLAGSANYPGPLASAAKWEDLGRSGDPGALDKAVTAANAGRLVMAGYQQPGVTDPVTGATKHTPGHVAIVRPQLNAAGEAAGPLVIMAGTKNWQSIHMANAFASHHGAWPAAIRLFAHDTDLQFDVTRVG